MTASGFNAKIGLRQVVLPDLRIGFHAADPEGKGDCECSAMVRIQADVSMWIWRAWVASAHRRGKAIDMTKQESFKRRVRTRMEKTGEKYGAARRNLIQRNQAGSHRDWVSEPELSDDAVREATGRGWDEWCDLIDAGPGKGAGHKTIVGFLEEEHDVGSWWAQGITVSYERITGLRLPHQNPDGTFTAGKSRTVDVEAETIRSALQKEEDRAELFPGQETQLRSQPGSKVVRLGIGGGVAQISLDSTKQGRTRISIQHEKLDGPEEVTKWKSYWADWLDAVAKG